MKALIIYESRFGNGKKLCQQLKEIITSKGHSAETFSVIDTDPKRPARGRPLCIQRPHKDVYACAWQ